MWQTASPMKIAAARAYGATVDDSPPDIPAAFEHLDRLVEETGRTLVHPYDDPLVMAGQGTVGLEMLEDVPDADVVLVQVGGGGLVSGHRDRREGLKPDARVFAIEPELSNALAASIAAGESVTVEPQARSPTASTGPYAGPNCVRICLDLGVENVLVTEDEIEEGFRFMYGRMKLACEVAGAATAAALLAGKVAARAGRDASPRSSRAATWQPKRPLLSWPSNEGRHPSRVRRRAPCAARAATSSSRARRSRSCTSRSARTATRSTRASRS